MDKVLHNINVYNQYTNAYIDRFMDLTLYKDTFDPLIQRLPVSSKVLELGCGPGNVLRHLRAHRSDLSLVGIDLSAEMIKAATRLNPEIEFRLMDIRQAHQISERFDAVIAAFCIPYLSGTDLATLCHNLKNLTVDRGLIYLSFMEGVENKSGFEKTSFTADSKLYITYYSRKQVELLINSNGFKINKLYTKDYLEPDGSVAIDIVYIAEKMVKNS